MEHSFVSKGIVRNDSISEPAASPLQASFCWLPCTSLHQICWLTSRFSGLLSNAPSLKALLKAHFSQTLVLGSHGRVMLTASPVAASSFCGRGLRDWLGPGKVAYFGPSEQLPLYVSPLRWEPSQGPGAKPTKPVVFVFVRQAQSWGQQRIGLTLFAWACMPATFSLHLEYALHLLDRRTCCWTSSLDIWHILTYMIQGVFRIGGPFLYQGSYQKICLLGFTHWGCLDSWAGPHRTQTTHT